MNGVIQQLVCDRRRLGLVVVFQLNIALIVQIQAPRIHLRVGAHWRRVRSRVFIVFLVFLCFHICLRVFLLLFLLFALLGLFAPTLAS